MTGSLAIHPATVRRLTIAAMDHRLLDRIDPVAVGALPAAGILVIAVIFAELSQIKSPRCVAAGRFFVAAILPNWRFSELAN